MIISKTIANRAPISASLILGLTSFIAVPIPTRILATIPSHPINMGTNLEIINKIEKASVPIDQHIIANLNLLSFPLKML